MVPWNTSSDRSAQQRKENRWIYIYLHEAKFQQWESRTTLCWYGFNVVCNFRIVYYGFTDMDLLKVMTSTLKWWRPSLLNNSWNSIKFSFDHSEFAQVKIKYKKKILGLNNKNEN